MHAERGVVRIVVEEDMAHTSRIGRTRSSSKKGKSAHYLVPSHLAGHYTQRLLGERMGRSSGEGGPKSGRSNVAHRRLQCAAPQSGVVAQMDSEVHTRMDPGRRWGRVRPERKSGGGACRRAGAGGRKTAKEAVARDLGQRRAAQLQKMRSLLASMPQGRDPSGALQRKCCRAGCRESHWKHELPMGHLRENHSCDDRVGIKAGRCASPSPMDGRRGNS